MTRRLEERVGALPFNLIVYAGIFLLVFAAYSFALKLSFIQDDFGFIVRHLPGGEKGWHDAFTPDGIYYRPFTQHIWYLLVNHIFHLNPFWYHLVNLLVHTANVILVYHIGRALTRSNNFGIFLALIYGTRTLAYHAVIWPSAVNELLVTFFLFATFLAHQRYVVTGKRAAWWASVFLYLMAMLSKENAPTLLPLLFIYHAWIYLPVKLDSKRCRQILVSLIPHMLMVAALAVMKFSQFSAIQQSEYHMSIGIRTIKTYLYFFLTFTNPPNTSTQVWKGMFVHLTALTMTLVAVAALVMIFLWLNALNYKRKIKLEETGHPVGLWEIGSMRLVIFGSAWWLIGFFVTATMPQHAQQYYGLYPSLGLALVVGVVIYDILLKLARTPRTRTLGYILTILIGLFLLTNYFLCVRGISNIDRFRALYKESEARRVREFFLTELPHPPQGAHFIVLEGGEDFKWVTSSGYELNMIYDDLSIKVSFPAEEDESEIEARGKPDFYIKFTPDYSIKEQIPHYIEIGKYEGN